MMGFEFFPAGYVSASPVPTYISSTGAGTYTVPAGAKRLKVTLKGPGCGGAGSGTTPGTVTAPTSDTTFGSLTAAKGAAPSGATGGAGGIASGGFYRVNGQAGAPGANGYTFHPGGAGGGAGGGRSTASAAGQAAVASSGGGGAGAGAGDTASPGGGGGEGAYVVAWIEGPLAASYSYTVGAGSAGGTAGTSGSTGGAGANGYILIESYMN